MGIEKTPASEQEYIDPKDDQYFDRKYFQLDWAYTFPDHPKGEDNFKRDPDGLYSDPVVRAAFALWREGRRTKNADGTQKRPKLWDYTPAESLYISQRAGIYDEDCHLTHAYMSWETWAPDVSEFRFDYKEFIFVVVQKGVNRSSNAVTWAVRDTFGSCLSLAGEWVEELSPSSRTAEWLAAHRFTSHEEAYNAGKKAFDEMVREYEARARAQGQGQDTQA